MSKFSSYEKDKKIFDNWRQFVIKEQEEKNKLAKTAGSALGKLNSWWKGADEFAQKKFCDVSLPQELKKGGDIKTFGHLQAVMKCSTQYKNAKGFINAVTNFIPYASNVKDVLGKSNDIKGFVLGMYQLPDDQRPPKGNLSKLDIDDPVAEIIDNKLEEEFLKYYIKKIQDDNMADKLIPEDWNITKEMTAWLQKAKQGRTITGFENESSK